VHAVLACLFLAIWPFTRLVHVWSVPAGYLVRPFVVYRRRGAVRVRR
jgi:nitrate reductase gamma subunit